MQPAQQTVQTEVVEVVVRDLLKAKGRTIKVPISLKSDFARHGGLVGGTAGGVGGAVIGAHLGLAGFFGAIPATWPLAIAALAVGGLAGSKLGEKVKRTALIAEDDLDQTFCPTCGLPQ